MRKKIINIFTFFLKKVKIFIILHKKKKEILKKNYKN